MTRLLALLLALAPAALRAQAPEAALLQDLSKARLDNLSDEEEKKRFLNTIAVEKMRIQAKMLRGTYESAFDLYKHGQYDSAQDVANRILAIDPHFEDAKLLGDAASRLKGSAPGWASERRMLEDKFNEALDLYQKGRLVESERKFEEVTKLNPSNLKARYWLKRVQDELAEAHYAKGLDSYDKGNLQDALDHWYAALLLNPGYPHLSSAIEKAEAEKRRQDTNRMMEEALTAYGDGRLDESLAQVRQILQLDPAAPKAQSLQREIQQSISTKHIDEGRKLYQARKFSEAIAKFQQAAAVGYDKDKANALVLQAKEQMRKDKEAKEKARELAEQRRKEAEEAKKAEAEEQVKTDQAASQDEYGMSGIQDLGAEKKAKAKPKTVDGKAVVGAAGASEVSPEAQKQATESQKREALQHYQTGMVYLQNKDLTRSKAELEQAKKLDPSNMEVDAALRRIDAYISGQ